MNSVAHSNHLVGMYGYGYVLLPLLFSMHLFHNQGSFSYLNAHEECVFVNLALFQASKFFPGRGFCSLGVLELSWSFMAMWAHNSWVLPDTLVCRFPTEVLLSTSNFFVTTVNHFLLPNPGPWFILMSRNPVPYNYSLACS